MPPFFIGGIMQLSKRLKALTDMVTRGNRVADIGCDHAYVSIYLMKNHIASHVIAMDVNKGPLARATENIAARNLSNDIETRLSDGAKKLQEGEADTILIAGMGGGLVIKILSESMNVVRGCKELILQPQSEIHLVRRFLHQEGYEIVEEKMLIDEGKYYTMMRVVPGVESYDKAVFDYFGKQLLEEKDVTLKAYLDHEYGKMKAILAQLEASEKRPEERIAELKEEVSRIEEGLNYYAM